MGTPRIKPWAALWEARTLSIVLCGPLALNSLLPLVSAFPNLSVKGSSGPGDHSSESEGVPEAREVLEPATTSLPYDPIETVQKVIYQQPCYLGIIILNVTTDMQELQKLKEAAASKI